MVNGWLKNFQKYHQARISCILITLDTLLTWCIRNSGGYKEITHSLNMKTSLANNVKSLKAEIHRFDAESNIRLQALLKLLSENTLQLSPILAAYYDALLFICAYPPDKRILLAAENELSRITSFLKMSRPQINTSFVNSGLPYTQYVSCFSHDFVCWLIRHPDCKVSIHSFEHATFQLNDVLKLTLPSLERSETTAGFSNTALLDALWVKQKQQLPFVLNELSRFDQQPYVKDLLFDGLKMYVNLTPRNKKFSRAYNRIPGRKIYFHHELIKRFDSHALLDTKIRASKLSSVEKANIILIIKNSMALKDRETDPVTYMDEHSLRFYELERGISIAIYGMIPARQMPLESYVGYTLFKNGFPAAYGGGWVFGERSDFGINIFESFRGGESGYMMCQLLRVFRQVFHIYYFQVEAYQYGLDNPEGIESAAFWFYYRYGFRPLDKKLVKIAEDEFKKISGIKNYHTSKKTLLKFTESNIALNLSGMIPVSVSNMTNKVRQMIQQEYNGNRLKAEQDAVKKFMHVAKLNKTFNQHENQVLKEVALWAGAFKIIESEKLNILCRMISVKPVDLYQYQDLLLQFFRR